jgi:hypothetical protein
MNSELERNIGKRDAIRAFCAVSRSLYPGYNWHSVAHLLAATWARHHGTWSWAEVRDDVRTRWEDTRRELCTGVMLAA